MEFVYISGKIFRFANIFKVVIISSLLNWHGVRLLDGLVPVEPIPNGQHFNNLHEFENTIKIAQKPYSPAFKVFLSVKSITQKIPSKWTFAKKTQMMQSLSCTLLYIIKVTSFKLFCLSFR
jgi:hypothetical protein